MKFYRFAILFSFFLILFFLPSLEFNSKPSSFVRKPTWERVTRDPFGMLNQLLGRQACQVKNALAGIQVHTASDPGNCTCDGISTMTGVWNSCLSCLFASLTNLYNQFAVTFSQIIDPDIDVDTVLPVNGVRLTVTAGNSDLAEYQRKSVLAVESSGAICISVYYTKHSEDADRLKALIHVISSNCPTSSDGDSESSSAHAIAMKFDIKYTDEDVQTSDILNTANYNDNGSFNVSDTNSSDSIFYMRVRVDESSGNPITTSHTLQVTKGAYLKFFLNGRDDVQLLLMQAIGADLSDTVRDSSDIAVNDTKCMADDTSEAELAASACSDDGYEFSDFPLSVSQISEKNFPAWTTSTLNIEGSTDVQDYFD